MFRARSCCLRGANTAHHSLQQSSRSLTGSALPRMFGIRERVLENERVRSASNDKLVDKLKSKEAVKVTVTGAAGAIGYAALFRIANGELLGPDQPIHLSCLELPPAMDALKGVMMELEDCAFPNLESLQGTDDANRAFDGCEIALFIGSKPRGPGMERADLLKDNGMIFSALGSALNKNAARHCRSIVVGNPCNTNCLILANNAPDLDRKNFTAMTRLDHDRGVAQIAHYFSLPSNVINYFAIWGNHSPTMFPDLTATTVHGVPFNEVFGEMKWDRYYRFELTPKVQQRGARVINVRGASSAASAANASIAHTRDWCLGSPQPDWTSMAVVSQGEYGVPEGLVFSYPVWCKDGQYSVVSVPYAFNDYSQYMIEQNIDELMHERDAVSHLLPN